MECERPSPGGGCSHEVSALLICALSAIAAGCSCGHERLREVEECSIESNRTAPEVCNDRDDNCSCYGDTNRDGTVCGPGDDGVDEGCDDDSDGYCDVAVPIEGSPKVCSRAGADCDDAKGDVHPDADETCNGRDDDCDGRVDTDDPSVRDARLAVQCGDGITPDKAGKGECRYGHTVCRYGAVICDGAKGPQNETCDGLDNDCNGVTDEGAASFELCWSPTNPLTGECKPGVYVCVAGKLDRTRCLNEVFPTTELCNGKDDNCNGKVDDGARSSEPVYVLFHLDCSGSMGDKINQIRTFLNDLNTLPSIYQSSQIKFGMTLYPDMSAGQLPWVHQTYTDLNTFRTSLSTVGTANCGGYEPNVDSVAYGLCSSRPTLEWSSTHLCRSLYDSEWNRCGGASGNAASYPAGTVCRSILTGGYQNSRIYDLPVPDAAHQLHVMITDEHEQSNKALTSSSVNGIKSDLRSKYASTGWNAKIRVACFLDSSYASQFSALCDRTYSLSSSTTSTQLMTDFTSELQDIYCQ